MATYIAVLLLLLLALLSAAMAADNNIPSKSHELHVAIEEMIRANYFTFVTLINMSPLNHRIQENVTFLMPNDRILSKTRIPHDSVSGFLLRHSIPSPLLFDHLQHIPSGSTIPSSQPEFKLDISNNGRRSFFLNNVKIISPNICTVGHSIRCHGIDGVLSARQENTPRCSNATTPVVIASPPAPSLPPASLPVGGNNQIPMAAPQPVQHVDLPKSSSGSCMSHERSFKFLVTSVLMLIMGFNT